MSLVQPKAMQVTRQIITIPVPFQQPQLLVHRFESPQVNTNQQNPMPLMCDTKEKGGVNIQKKNRHANQDNTQCPLNHGTQQKLGPRLLHQIAFRIPRDPLPASLETTAHIESWERVSLGVKDDFIQRE